MREVDRPLIRLSGWDIESGLSRDRSISVAKTRPSMYLIGKQLSRTRPICTGIQRSMSESAASDWTGDAQGLKLGTCQ